MFCPLPLWLYLELINMISKPNISEVKIILKQNVLRHLSPMKAHRSYSCQATAYFSLL